MNRQPSSSRFDRDASLGAERRQQGYVVILPGIEGHSRWNRSIRRGLLSAGVPYAIEIHDWTRGPHWYFWNLRDRSRHREQAREVARKIVEYRSSFPNQPVYLIGHSGGGAMTAFILEELPSDVQISGGIMLVGALSPWYDLRPALRQTERGLWNYSAHGDLFFVGLGTTVCGTCDGTHSPASGLVGFHRSAYEDAHGEGLPPLHQMWFQWQMLRDFNFAGHLSCVNPRFIRNWIAPIVMGREARDRSFTRKVTPPVAARVLCHTAESQRAEPQTVR